MSLPLFELPLQSGGPPTGYSGEHHSVSDQSLTVAFDMGLDQRDKFFGEPACVICGEDLVERCHIIPQAETKTWTDLKNRGWIPQTAKKSPAHEPRNGLLLCPNHHTHFNLHLFYICFSPEKFILINHSNRGALQKFHGKAIALDIRDHHAPFASLFIIHQCRVQGFNPFQPTDPTIPTEITWQDWISSSGAYDDESGFNRNGPQDNENVISQHASTGEFEQLAEPNNDVIAEILAATRAQPSWKACELENTSWDGTAEENAKKYLDIMGR